MAERRYIERDFFNLKEKKDKFFYLNLGPGSNLWDKDPDEGGAVKGVVPRNANLGVLFNLRKGKAFVPGIVKDIKDIENRETEKIDVGLDDFWILRKGNNVFINKSSLGHRLEKIKEDKKGNYKQPVLSQKVFKKAS